MRPTEVYASAPICNAANGNASLVNLLNVADAERQSIVARLVKAKHGVKVIDGGVLNVMPPASLLEKNLNLLPMNQKLQPFNLFLISLHHHLKFRWVRWPLHHPVLSLSLIALSMVPAVVVIIPMVFLPM
jgi:hypothetical protein